MNKFTIDLQQRNFTEYIHSPNLSVTPKKWSASEKGGPLDAEIQLSGPAGELAAALDWLRYPVKIINRQGTPVWWGVVATVEIKLKSLSLAVSLDNLTNRVKVIYSYQGADGTSQSGETDWTQDANSVAEYGTWEIIKSIGEATSQRATQEITNTLGDNATPATTEFTVGGEAIDRGEVTLSCRGWFSTLTAKYFARPDGVEKHTSGNTGEISLGQKITANTIGFEPNNDYIHDLNGQLSNFQAGQRVRVSGAVNSANNSTFRIERGTNQTVLTIVSNQIYFDPTDDVHIAGTGFSDIDANDLIFISGAGLPENNGYFWTVAVAESNHATVLPASISLAGSGPTVTVKRGHAIGVTGGLISELPGATVSLTVLGEQMAQRFTLSQAVGFYLYEAYIKLAKIGAPADGVTVAIYTDNAGVPGVVIESSSVAVSSIYAQSEWIRFDFTGATALAVGVTYWLVVRRSGASAPSNYYTVGIDKDGGYGSGTLRLWDGAAWVSAETDSDMYFALWGKETVTDQIKKIVSSSGQFIQSCQIIDASSLYTYQYRDGSLKAKDEVESLLDSGDGTGRRMTAEVTDQRIMLVRKRPDATSQIDSVMVTMDNRWTDIAGSRLEEGFLPVGKWAEVRGLPADIAAVARVNPFYVGFAEYNADTGELHCDRNSNRALGDLGKVQLG